MIIYGSLDRLKILNSLAQRGHFISSHQSEVFYGHLFLGHFVLRHSNGRTTFTIKTFFLVSLHVELDNDLAHLYFTNIGEATKPGAKDPELHSE